MSSDPRPAVQRTVPYLSYADASAALEFLAKAFGFEERFRFPMPDGRLGHAELTLDGTLALMLASAYPEIGFESPAGSSTLYSQVYCNVPDVDAHYERARAAGATVIAEPQEEHGSRSYRAVDPEGHRWIFAMPVKETGAGA